MTDENMRKKIAMAAARSYDDWVEEDYAKRIQKIDFDKLADALIAAGIGDVSSHRVFVGKDGIVKQIYSGEEVEQIVKERDELKVELRSKVDYIHEQDEIIKDYKHRAEVAEKALKLACKTIAPSYTDTAKLYFVIFTSQAEKEITEEKKDEQA